MAADYVNNRADAWGYGNTVLYRMCHENPRHSDAEVTAGKLWLIGRAYAASPERGSGKALSGQDPDFFKYLAGSGEWQELDKRLDEARTWDGFNERTLPAVLRTHAFFVGLMSRRIAPRLGDEGRPRGHTSFASKYLHFHAPDHFPIYDSYVSLTLAREYERARLGRGNADVDERYSRFCQLALRYRDDNEDAGTLRDMDRVLYEKQREWISSRQPQQ